jgi:hypothetical protein
VDSRALAIAVILLPNLVGCVPNTAIYYRPSAEGGKVVSDCAGVPRRVELKIGTLPFSVYATTTRGEGVVSLSFGLKPREVVEFSSFSFSSDNFRIRDLSTNFLRRPSSISVYRNDGSESVVAPYLFPEDTQSALLGAPFLISTHFPEGLPRDFELLSPSLILDGIERGFPVIHFERKPWVGISPFNC